MRIIALVMILGVLVFFPLVSSAQNKPVVLVDDLYVAKRMIKHSVCNDVLISIDDHFPAEYRVKVKRGPLDYYYVSYRGQLIGQGRTYFYNSTARDACAIVKRHFSSTK